MRLFQCDQCGQTVFFENVRCVRCGHALGYAPDTGRIVAFVPAQDVDNAPAGTVTAAGRHYRLCDNSLRYNVCNFLVEANDPNSLCVSCRLTRALPDLNQTGNLAKWYRIEVAKRRLFYTLTALGLPMQGRSEDAWGGLTYEFLADQQNQPVLTGHDSGVITINLAEADDAERARRREQLYEPYRTLLGHLRHEIGHFYWDKLIAGSDRLAGFRALFGDDTQDYLSALANYYAQGAPADWGERYVSSYASSHAWEDWAETWAHYLHMVDTLETAASYGVALNALPSFDANTTADDDAFQRMVDHWRPLTMMLNSLNRGMGLPDNYPFVLPPAALDKLRFVHDTVCAASVKAQTQTQALAAGETAVQQAA